MKILFATNNQNKIKEIQAAIGNSVEVIGLKDAGINIDIPEPHDTLEKNAKEKSSVIYSMTAMSCFSEDTGLEIQALGGEPGVLSARYSGGTTEDNIDKVLQKLEGISNRGAQFKTVISLIWKGEEYLFEGICRGVILPSRRGTGGFGYDPIFVPDGSELSFGEMNMNEKNEFSHRKKAAARLVSFLQQQNSPEGAIS